MNHNQDNYVAMFSILSVKHDRLKKKLESKDLEIDFLKREVRHYKSLSEDTYEDVLADRDIEVKEAYEEINKLKFLFKVFLFLM